jgi:hypothetical protein
VYFITETRREIDCGSGGGGGGEGWEGDRIRMFEAKYSPDGSTRNGALRNTRIC